MGSERYSYIDVVTGQAECTLKYHMMKNLKDFIPPPPPATFCFVFRPAQEREELRRRRRLMSALLAHPCLPQLQDVAGLIAKRYGDWPPLDRMCSYPEVRAPT